VKTFVQPNIPGERMRALCGGRTAQCEDQKEECEPVASHKLAKLIADPHGKRDDRYTKTDQQDKCEPTKTMS
jgi:hypothetical protein